MSPIVGVIGGGQLARMMLPPAIELGIEVRVFAETRGESADLGVTAVGDFRVTRATCSRSREASTSSPSTTSTCRRRCSRRSSDAGIAVRPDPAALLYAQDKLLMRERLGELGLPMPDWARVTSAADLDAFLAAHGGRAVLKTPRGGYDGKGVRVVRSSTEADGLVRRSATTLLVEELVDFRRELAQLVARRPSGELELWPVVESMQRDGVCAEVIAPAPSSAGRIADLAADIAVDHRRATRRDRRARGRTVRNHR